MNPEWSFDVIMLPCVPGIVLYQETFPPNYIVFKFVGNKLPGIRLCRRFDPGWKSQYKLSFHSHLFMGHFSAGNDHLQGPSQQKVIIRTYNIESITIIHSEHHTKPLWISYRVITTVHETLWNLYKVTVAITQIILKVTKSFWWLKIMWGWHKVIVSSYNIIQDPNSSWQHTSHSGST